MKKIVYFLVIVALVFFSIGKEVYAEDTIPIYNMNREEKNLYLTFDLNWGGEEKIYEILDILKRENVKATFFVMGRWIEMPKGNEKKLSDIQKDGHNIGNHSYLHKDFSKISKDEMEKEIKKTEKILCEKYNITEKIFRFPSGAYTKEAVKRVEELGYKMYQWDVDSIDWKNEGEEIEFKRVKNKIQNGSIILYHNNGKFTPKNLEKLIKYSKENGYNFKKIGDN